MPFNLYQCEGCYECYYDPREECPKCKHTIFKTFTYEGERFYKIDITHIIPTFKFSWERENVDLDKTIDLDNMEIVDKKE
jgi:hypothetical protein